MSEPINVAVVSNAGVRSGLMETPEGQPNVRVRAYTPVVAIGVRAIHLFLNTLVGLVVAGAFTETGQQLLGASDFLTLVQNAAWMSLVPAGVGLLKDLVTIFGRLEQKFPLSTGQV